jgi:hypothetical protein
MVFELDNTTSLTHNYVTAVDYNESTDQIAIGYGDTNRSVEIYDSSGNKTFDSAPNFNVEAIKLSSGGDYLSVLMESSHYVYIVLYDVNSNGAAVGSTSKGINSEVFSGDTWFNEDESKCFHVFTYEGNGDLWCYAHTTSDFTQETLDTIISTPYYANAKADSQPYCKDSSDDDRFVVASGNSNVDFHLDLCKYDGSNFTKEEEIYTNSSLTPTSVDYNWSEIVITDSESGWSYYLTANKDSTGYTYQGAETSPNGNITGATYSPYKRRTTGASELPSGNGFMASNMRLWYDEHDDTVRGEVDITNTNSTETTSRAVFSIYPEGTSPLYNDFTTLQPKETITISTFYPNASSESTTVFVGDTDGGYSESIDISTEKRVNGRGRGILVNTVYDDVEITATANRSISNWEGQKQVITDASTKSFTDYSSKSGKMVVATQNGNLRIYRDNVKDISLDGETVMYPTVDDEPVWDVTIDGTQI